MIQLPRCTFVSVPRECNAEQFVIRDTSTDGCSITNDVENLVGYLYHVQALRPGQRLFYYDSDGLRCEIEHAWPGRFKSFGVPG